jgi:hypothetical protein
MTKKYQGKTVRSSREAREGDQGFVKGTDQVTITFDDGTEKTVKRSEVRKTSVPGGSANEAGRLRSRAWHHCPRTAASFRPAEE